ncbi:MAG TPA: hypothetical protein V6C50_03185 [Crinalium sp.]
MNLFRWAVLPAITAAVLLPAFRAAALPVEPDYPCYLRTASGKVLDLSAAVCGMKKAEPTSSLSSASASNVSTQTLLADYRRLAKQPLARGLFDDRPEALLKNAKGYCEARKVGLSDRDIAKAQAQGMTSTDPRVTKATIEALAIADVLGAKYFCPEHFAGLGSGSR